MGDPLLHPGWPLPATDYRPLLEALDGVDVVLGHSLGALRALRDASGRPVVLLAPSLPDRRRPLRPALRMALRALDRSPAAPRLAASLRDATWARWGAAAPPGAPMPLRVAAERLRAVSGPLRADGVICSRDDAAHPSQERLAARLGARVAWVDGGHLHPLTEPTATAAAIRAAIG